MESDLKRLDDAKALTRIESLIVHFRHARNEPGTEEHETYLALKQAAEDLRARNAIMIRSTERELLIAIGRADDDREERQSRHYAPGHLRAIAELLIGRWHTVVSTALREFADGEDGRK